MLRAMTLAWRHLVLGKALGRYIVGNALIAYGLFQGWGNDPKAFVDGLQKAGYATDPNYADKINTILNGEVLGSAVPNDAASAAGALA